MSDKGRSFVIEYSPYTGTTFLVHYMLGDLENATYNHELFMGRQKLARQCRISEKTLSRAVAEMVADGFLEALSEHASPGNPLRYRFVFLRKSVDNLSTDSEPSVDNLSTDRWTSTESHSYLTKEEPKRAAAPTERPRDLLFEALCEVSGAVIAELTPSARGAINNAKGELVKVGATPDEIRRRASAWTKQYPDIPVSAQVLKKHWATLGHAGRNTAVPKCSVCSALYIDTFCGNRECKYPRRER